MTNPDTSKDIASVYRFLAQCMEYPDRSWMSKDFFQALDHLLEQLGGQDEKEAIHTALDNPGDFADFIEDLQVEYTRLFINGIPHLVAPPYGSVYMDKSLQGKFAGDTLAFYREKGFAMGEKADLPDHLIHELEFLSLLASESDHDGEALFLKKFFRPWFGEFHRRVTLETHHPYFRVISQLIDFFTKEDDNNGFQPNPA